ncbi:hypothetical protein GCM10017322_31160 [Paracoccus aerius]|nr:hypothetical protein GCM10017322_31160 [Paracoccus aerius]
MVGLVQWEPELLDPSTGIVKPLAQRVLVIAGATGGLGLASTHEANTRDAAIRAANVAQKAGMGE